MPVRSLGKHIGKGPAAAVNRFGTSLVVFSSSRSFTVARRTAQAARFTVVDRVYAHGPLLWGFQALADGRFLLLYVSKQRLFARNLTATGHFDGRPHLLAAGIKTAGVFYVLPTVAVDSDALRTVVVWGVTHGATAQVDAAIDDQSGWSKPRKLWSRASSSVQGFFHMTVVGDSQDRFLFSVKSTNDPAAVMRGLPGGSRQWEPVTPPERADAANPDSFAALYGTKVASVNGTITAAWQNASGAVVVSTWNGSTWAAPVTAIAGSKNADGYPIYVNPLFVSDGSRVALIWSDFSHGLSGPVEATIRATPAGAWSSPVVFAHSRGEQWVPFASTIDTFWFTASGELAGVWSGDPIRGTQSGGWDAAGLWTGTAGGSAITLSRKSRTPGSFVLTRAGGVHTIVWTDSNGQTYWTTAAANGTVAQKQHLPGCGSGYGASNPEASAQLLLGGVRLKHGGCSSALLW
jgi:hypothetical protein